MYGLTNSANELVCQTSCWNSFKGLHLEAKSFTLCIDAKGVNPCKNLGCPPPSHPSPSLFHSAPLCLHSPISCHPSHNLCFPIPSPPLKTAWESRESSALMTLHWRNGFNSFRRKYGPWKPEEKALSQDKTPKVGHFRRSHPNFTCYLYL